MRKITAIWAHLLLLSATIVTLGCAVPKYDLTTDQQLTKLQKDIDSQAVQLIAASNSKHADIKKLGEYGENVKSYNQIEVDMLAVQMRMQAQSIDSKTWINENFEAIRTNIENQRKKHEADGHLNADYVQAFRNINNTRFISLFTYEQVLKTDDEKTAKGKASGS
jgi:hypothetical protein